MSFTIKQNKIISSVDYPSYIQASAGTGKTEVIIGKISDLIISQNVNLLHMAAITFTNKATNEMIERLNERLYDEWRRGGYKNSFLRQQIDTVHMARISTIHSFCGDIIRKYGFEINISPDFAIGGFKYQTDNIITEVIKEHYEGRALADVPTYKVHDFIKTLYHTNSNQGVEITEIAVGSQPFWIEMKNKLLFIYKEVCVRVENEKKRCNLVTHNDLIKYAARLLQIETVARAVAAELDYLFVDETQDTNRDQYRLIDALIANGVKVLVAGDKKQSIYAFRGADLKSFDKMTEALLSDSNDCEKSLNENFRTDEAIVDFFNFVFSSTFEFNGKKLDFDFNYIDAQVKGESAEDKVTLYHCMDLVKVVKNLAQISPEAKKPCYNGAEGGLDTVCYNRSIGVLCRNNIEIGYYSGLLQQAGIPIKVIGGKSFYKSKEILDTFKVFNAVINNGEREQSELKYTDYYQAYNRQNDKPDDKRFYDLINELRHSLRNNTIVNFLGTLYGKTKIIEFYFSLGREQGAANLSKLKDICRNKHDEGMQPTGFLQFLDVMTSSAQDEDSAVVKGDKGVTLTTIHKSKGLAFDIVIIPNIDTNLNKKSLRKKLLYNAETNAFIINKDKLLTHDAKERIAPDELYEFEIESEIVRQIEEELRVYYVAFTRVRHNLILGTDKPKDKLKYKMAVNPEYVSMYRWIHETNGGQLISKIEK